MLAYAYEGSNPSPTTTPFLPYRSALSSRFYRCVDSTAGLAVLLFSALGVFCLPLKMDAQKASKKLANQIGPNRRALDVCAGKPFGSRPTTPTSRSSDAPLFGPPFAPRMACQRAGSCGRGFMARDGSTRYRSKLTGAILALFEVQRRDTNRPHGR